MMNKIRKYFFTGLVVLLPITLTIYLFVLLINFSDSQLAKYLPAEWVYYVDKIPGLSILIAITVIVIIGFFATNFLGKKIFEFFEKFFFKLPFFRQVYPAIKEMAMFLFSQERGATFKQVVLVEYPRKGIYAFGFLTNNSSAKICDKVNQELYNVFLPSAPGPLTGYVIVVPKKEIIFTDISIEDAFKFIVSGGVVNPA